MKQSIVLFMLLVTSTVLVCAQERSRGLVLYGSVQRVGTQCIHGQWVAEIQVYLQFHNDTASRILIYQPSELFSVAINYGTNDSTSTAVQSFRTRYDIPEDFDPYPGILRRLDVEDPTTVLRTIEPRGYYEYRDTFWPKSGFKVDVSPIEPPPRWSAKQIASRPCGVTRAAATPEHRSFRLKYDLGLRKYKDGSEFLRALQVRWKPFGNFILAGNEDIGYESEEIILDTKK